VEFSTLPAGINRRWQIGEQLAVELAPDEGFRQLPGIDAREHRLDSSRDHLARERRRF